MSELRGGSRDFISKVAAAVFANPFGAERRRVDLELSQAPSSLARGEVVDRALARLDTELRRLGGGRAVLVSRYAGDDRERLELAVLFALFHRHADEFDALIGRELAAEQRPLEVPFGRKALAEFSAHGFEAEEARRYF